MDVDNRRAVSSLINIPLLGANHLTCYELENVMKTLLDMKVSGFTLRQFKPTI